MKKVTIAEIKKAAKAAGCKIRPAGRLNGFPAYRVITDDRSQLMTSANLRIQFRLGELF